MRAYVMRVLQRGHDVVAGPNKTALGAAGAGLACAESGAQGDNTGSAQTARSSALTCDCGAAGLAPGLRSDEAGPLAAVATGAGRSHESTSFAFDGETACSSTGIH